MLIKLPKITSDIPSQLKVAIRNLCSSNIKLFEYLKFKFYLLIHCPKMLKRLAPTVHFWCMQYESRHRLLKAASNAGSGTKNIVKSISIKEILRSCYSRHTQEISNTTDFGPNAFSFCFKRRGISYKFHGV